MNANAIAGVELADPGLAAATAEGLSRVEELLHREVHSDYQFVTETSLHLIDAGGKRFRPLFTLLAAQVGPRPDDDDVHTAAAVVELIHLATLYHDDVMDSATMRRGAESANSRWDNTVAILTGDFLFAHASRLVADLGPDAVRIIAETFAELVTGQMRETRGPRHGEDPVEHYLAVIAEKTGSLIATSGRYGGMFSGCAPEHVEALRRFGATIGTAFQISDDVIDIASPSDSSGKTPGTDLREGIHTLPMLYALQDSGPEAERLGVLLARPITDDGEVDEALELLRTGRGLARARDVLADQAAAARAELGKLPACPATEALASLTTYVVDRTA
ncbi:polyprenyl synthetase family protein [Pseudonocardia sp. DSM 110487]|uniref:polyprenyl synthetase family protein n=1 Tax=Pseudonocardia sp. DSM 110487 TaxID=2865833 RepID=UPI001C69BA98|nr:polyprenyl synthetase family protein [Pseudonocardia sp. DSM 110487]QYN35210.1 polyprenyl synthetase family protein [Pseudonocardia sp. DSM 110487]